MIPFRPPFDLDPFDLLNIDTLEMIEGDLPKRAKKLVIEWAKMNKDEMKKMWDSQEFHKLPPLE
ncbi:DUF4160 domain-containing protein [Methylomarinum sp. Ch1-1]|uniref:DUF4160 domain-containing protein n=1 Tax=Methylomarinum roseum TaxID=3067653 RepID=A0AAU7NY45_9GAMM